MADSNVVNFPQHKFYRCKCNETDCQFCEGGLHLCLRCNGFEATMPEDCPGTQMTEEQMLAVQDGKLDYRRKLGGWTTWTRTMELHNRGLTL